ncbi:glycerol-3-phosphate ABC transporter ATP-binding protein [Prosthecomicrobium hirschii]|uniref:Glycerol-3-phosphate ABC transporter ATP-binding protein n=2 Tax=Prosthecodimorpha hirschii TaxID=665126 RepID=A0A0P6VM93_9HYPH|nr:ABC transporter ATP-binding protein [Prosthecomicrobium hirschii]KPL53045.1 glycerol-3-phosphate ABC transporter ATP-binding protein [Prosthecomicrobium hirschii]
MAGVTIASLHKRFGAVRAVDDVSLDLSPGEFVSLVGPSGCGKTTLMRIVAGLERAEGGTVSIAGRDVTGLRGADRNVAMVFQSYALYPHMTARQNIALPLVMRRLGARQRLPLVGRAWPGTRAALAGIEADVIATAESLGLGHLLDRKPAQLSGGQRQRVALGRAIVRRPDVFLMDEPLSNLDAALRVQTRKEIVDLHRRAGASTIYVTHDQAEALTMSDRVAVMMAGRILQVANPTAVYDDPRDLRVARFIGSPRINTLAAEIGADGLVRVAGQAMGLAASARGAHVYALRPEHLVLAPAPLMQGRGLAARVEHVEFLGEALLVHARLTATGEDVVARIAPEDRNRLPADGVVGFVAAPGRGLLFGADEARVAAVPTAPMPAGARVHG